MKKCIKIATVGLLALGLTACGKEVGVVESNEPAIEYVYEEAPVETQREELVPEVTEPIVEETTSTEEATVGETETVEETPITEEVEPTTEESEVVESSSTTEEVTNNVSEETEVVDNKVETTSQEETIIYQPRADLALTVLLDLARNNNLVLTSKALSYFSSNFEMNENTTYAELVASVQAAYNSTEDYAKDFILDVIRNNQ